MDQIRVERRSGADRRKKSTVNVRALVLGGRRERGRRLEDRSKTFLVDRYSPYFLAAIVSILFLSVIDALLTLFLINRGALELNPVMAYYLDLGPYRFLAVKYALTCIGVVSFLLLRNIYLRPFRMYTGSLFYFVLVVFAGVVAWQLYLVTRVIV
jgi:hypothetical protein